MLESEKRFIQQVDGYVLQACNEQDLTLIRHIDEQAQMYGITFYDMFSRMPSNEIKEKLSPQFETNQKNL